MVASFVAFLMLAAGAPASPRVETLPNGQFRVIVARQGMNGERFIGAVLESRAEAARHCHGRGNPIEIGSGRINSLPDERWEMVSTYTCEEPPPPLAPPPEGT